MNKLGVLLNFSMALAQGMVALIVMFNAIRQYLGDILIGAALVYINITNIIQRSIQTLASHIHMLYDSTYI